MLVTTNFSLTYFIVSGEIENSGVSAHLVIVETEGMSVLTGWAAGKFTGEKIAAFVKASGIEQQVKTRRLIIPGYVAQISGELEEGLPGWEIARRPPGSLRPRPLPEAAGRSGVTDLANKDTKTQRQGYSIFDKESIMAWQ